MLVEHWLLEQAGVVCSQVVPSILQDCAVVVAFEEHWLFAHPGVFWMQEVPLILHDNGVVLVVVAHRLFAQAGVVCSQEVPFILQDCAVVVVFEEHWLLAQAGVLCSQDVPLILHDSAVDCVLLSQFPVEGLQVYVTRSHEPLDETEHVGPEHLTVRHLLTTGIQQSSERTAPHDTLVSSW